MRAEDLFEILVREHAGMLTAYLAAAVRDPATVDDLFQETMLTAWRRLGDFDRAKPFGPWLRGIARNLVLAEGRQSARRHTFCDESMLDHLGQRMQQLEQQPGDTFDERLAALRACMELLSEEERQTLKMRYESKLSRERIAEQCQVAAETVKKRLQRTRAKLLKCIEGKLAVEEGAS